MISGPLTREGVPPAPQALAASLGRPPRRIHHREQRN